MQNAAQRWFKFQNIGPNPCARSAHAMASDGTCVFVLGGDSKSAQAEEMSLIHVLDTSMYFFIISSGQPLRLRIRSHQVPGN